MRTALVRRAVLTASAVSLSLLATACGSGDADKKADDAKPSAGAAAPAASEAPAAKGKTDAEVTALVVTQADLPDQLVKPEGAAKAALVAAESDNAACKPLVQVQSTAKIGTATGIGRTGTKAKPKELPASASAEEKIEAGLMAMGGAQTLVTVASYDGKGAAEAFAAVKAAGTACAAGYTVTSEGEKVKFNNVTPGAAVTGGDEAVSYTADMDMDGGEKSTTHFVIVRKGNSLATFYTYGLKTELPKSVVDAQVKKLG
ncbi:hypothetical protein ABZZ17_02090 [Streptomyces sp. NPDC006512]|uniref:hypothetical protein n=1 Tax=Streptomyces sp. NPDC006512 TaxID=3154307 RepID=UPI0033AA6FB2